MVALATTHACEVFFRGEAGQVAGERSHAGSGYSVADRSSALKFYLGFLLLHTLTCKLPI